MRRSLFTVGRMRIPKKNGTEILNQFVKKRIEFSGYLSAEDYYEISYPYRERNRISSLVEKSNCEILPPEGLMYKAIRALRPGLLIGAMLFSFLLWFSLSFLWDVRIHSDTDIDREAVLSALDEAGFSIGTFLPRQDLDAIENRIMETSDEVAWISINLYGVVAVCEVIAAKEGDDIQISPPANIVAEEDALITEIAVRHGTPAVSVGDVVKKGTLLISGILEGAHTSTLVAAEGAVYGQVKRTFTVLVPSSYTVMQEEAPMVRKRSLSFFGQTLLLYQSKAPVGEKVHKATEERPLSLFGEITLPICFVTETEIPYTEAVRERSKREMTEAAISEMNAVLADLEEDAELVAKKWTGTFTEEGYLLTCEAILITDITKSVPITVVP